MTTDVSITQNGKQLAGLLDLDSTIPADRIGTTALAASLLNDAGLGGLTIVTKGAIRIGAPVTLADGGSVALLAPVIALSASVTAPGGQVTIGNQSPVYFTANSANFLDATDATGAARLSTVALASGVAIDTRGVFTNLSIDPTSTAGEAFVNGGPVTIDTSGVVTIAAGSTIDASAGGAVLASRAAKGGVGGAVSITAYDPNDLTAAAPSTPVTIAARVRALGSGAVLCTSCKGGTLTLNVPAVLIGGGVPADPSTVSLTPDFFTTGFSSYAIIGQNGLTVANGTRIAAEQPIQQFTSATALTPGGSDPAKAFSIVLPPLYTPNPATAAMVQRPGASLTLRSGTPDFATGGITIGTGSVITVDPSQSIVLEAQGQVAIAGTQGQITLNGTIIAPSGAIKVVNDQFKGASDSLSIWLGETSVLDVSARAYLTCRLGP